MCRFFCICIQTDSGVPFFSLKLVYRGDTLTEAVLNGTPLSV